MRKMRIFSLTVLLAFIFISFVIGVTGFVSAQEGPSGRTAGILDFLGIGGVTGTWTEVIVGILIIIIIVAALYDILGIFTAFESRAVKILISVSVALISTMTGLVRTFSKWAFALAGGATSLGISILIIAAVAAFVLVHFGSSGLARRMIAGRAEIRGARAAGNAEEAGATLRGFTKGATGKRKP